VTSGPETVEAWAVAALLESEGLRDVDARDRYGRADLFEFAREV
jgi:predicted ATPase